MTGTATINRRDHTVNASQSVVTSSLEHSNQGDFWKMMHRMGRSQKVTNSNVPWRRRAAHICAGRNRNLTGTSFLGLQDSSVAQCDIVKHAATESGGRGEARLTRRGGNGEVRSGDPKTQACSPQHSRSQQVIA